MPADRIDPLPQPAAGVSLAPVVQPLRAPGAQRCAPSFTPQGTDSGELTGSRRAPARGGFLLGAEHGAACPPYPRTSAFLTDAARTSQPLQSGDESGRFPEGASPNAGRSVVGACILIALFLAMALFGGCEHPLHANPGRFHVERTGHQYPTLYLLTDKQTGAQFLVQDGGAITQVTPPAPAAPVAGASK